VNGQSVNQLLVTELRSYNAGSELSNEIASCVGLEISDIEANQVEVRGYWMEPTPEVFTAWLFTDHVLGMHQRSREGETFTLTVPLARVRRVGASGKGDTLSVLLEIEADKQVIVLNTEEATAFLRAAGYEIIAVGPKRIALQAFVNRLRNTI
jgi:hypothetical protein